MTSNKVVPFLCLASYLLFIFYITLYNRNFSLLQSCRMELFWSYNAWLEGKDGIGKQILLNIALFVPLGFFLSYVLKCWLIKRFRIWTMLFSFGITVTIETIQYVDGLGLCELDDVFDNVIGAWVGSVLLRVCESLDMRCQRPWYKKAASVAFLVAMIISCQMIGPAQSQQPYKQFLEYDFAVQNIFFDENNLTLDGYCRANYRDDMPRYQIVLKEEKSGKLYNADTIVDGDVFRAYVSNVSDEKYEVDIIFKYYSPVSTFSFINKGRVEDVSGAVPKPGIEGTDLWPIVNQGILKAYSSSYDTYVYQYDNRLYWLIGTLLDNKTTVVCYLYTNETNKLPEKMKKYKCDIQDFRAGTKNELTHTMNCGHYRLFYRDIPSAYNVVAVWSGFYANKKVKWQKYFRVLHTNRA